jgi:hypothetical protein
MKTQFKARDTFIIKGRGLVLAGWITEGDIKIGMSLTIPTFPRQLIIDGLETITSIDPNYPKLGLFFRSTDQTEILLWKQLNIKDKVFGVSYLL